MRRLALAAAVLALAGCGGGAGNSPPKPPRLPRALAQSWARQADEVANALAAGDGCTAQQLAGELRSQVDEAVSAGRASRRLLEALSPTVDELPDQITCTPPKHEKPKPPPKHEHGHGKKH